MVNITFKNVGQGDSIIIEWEKEEQQNSIAVIDCNLFSNTNPVLEEIKKRNISNIEFLLLSHPHLDHFSGFLELINYCIDHDIIIKRFLHTSQTTPDYLKSATRSNEESNKLIELFTRLNQLVKLGKIEVYAVDNNPNIQIPLGSEFKMEILSPSSIELNNYINGVQFPFDNETISHPNGNWLSTLLNIYNDHINIILTSDVEKSVFNRISKKLSDINGRTKIGLAQIPHHGSKGNLNKKFWQLRKRLKTTPLVISSGPNSYKHPSVEVLEFFQNLANYEVYRTDNNMTSRGTKKSIIVTSLLNVVSSEYFQDISSSDVKYQIKQNIVQKVN